MILFQTQIEEHRKLAEHYRELAAKREAKAAELAALESEVMGAVQTLVDIKQKLDADAAAALQSAVMNLLSQGGNQPQPPAPEPNDSTSPVADDDDFELLCLNGQASQLEECPDSSRTGQCYELASPLVCLLWEDAPLLGQHSAVTFESSQPPTAPFVELIKVCDAIAYQKKHDGEICCCYVGFEKKSVAKSWMKFLEPMAAHQELRQAQRLQEYQWELKLKGLRLGQIQKLSQEPIDKVYRSNIESLKPPIVKPHTAAAQPVQPGEVEAGDIVTSLLTPDGSYKIIQIMPNGILDCENLTTGDRLGLRPGAVSLVEKAQKLSQLALDVNAKPEVHAKYARVKLKADDFYGQVFPVVRETEQGSTLLTHLGNRWFRADCLEVIEPDAPVLAAVGAADDGFDF